jgi:hypothetical protein
MVMTTNFTDARRFADAVTAAGGTVPDSLANLLAAHALLARPGATQPPERDIVTHALSGDLTERVLDKLLPAATAAAASIAYRQELARSCGHTLLGAFHRAVKGGAADEILNSLRPAFDKAAAAIDAAMSLINPESTPEAVLAGGAPGTIEAWQGLDKHVRAVARIGAVAAAFGPRNGNFPQIVEHPPIDNFRLHDLALLCTSGPLIADSALFSTPDRGHRTSPWARTALQLHSIESARARYNAWAADEVDAVNSSRPRGGWIDEHGRMHQDPVPPNPFREKART